MYLPEYHSRMSPEVFNHKNKTSMRSGFLSKSCENITQVEMKELMRSRSPSPSFHRNDDTNLLQEKSNQKKKKFTFQSTIRLLENRKIAERLGREAELKGNCQTVFLHFFGVLVFYLLYFCGWFVFVWVFVQFWCCLSI